MNLSLLFSFKTEVWTKITVTSLKSVDFRWCKRLNILFSSLSLFNLPYFLLSLPHMTFPIELLLPCLFFFCFILFLFFSLSTFQWISLFFTANTTGKQVLFLPFTDRRNILWQNPKLAKQQAHKWNHHHHKYQWQWRCQLSQVLDLEGEDWAVTHHFIAT